MGNDISDGKNRKELPPAFEGKHIEQCASRASKEKTLVVDIKIVKYNGVLSHP